MKDQRALLVVLGLLAFATAAGCGPAARPAGRVPAEPGASAAVPEWATPPATDAAPDAGEPAPPPTVRVITEIVYARVEGRELELDLYLPAAPVAAGHPLVIWIHGGAWRKGSRQAGAGKASPLVARGLALAAIEYRFSDAAPFPAQIRDCLAAVRFLRANAAKYGLDPDRFGVWGASAGGHLAALVGTAAEVAEFNDGQHAEVSARVQAVCDWFGPTDLLKLQAQTGPGSALDHESADSPEGRLVGGPLNEEAYRARALAASPLHYVDAGAPPFLIMHGDRDGQIPLEQSASLHRALLAQGVESSFVTVRGAGHGFKVSPPERRRLVEQVVAFFERHL